MLTKRLIACFDIVQGRVTKALHFLNNLDVGLAEDLAETLYTEGIDEIIFYDINASAEQRSIDIEAVKRTAAKVFIPFAVGGGIKNIDDMYLALKAGAEKISVDSMAVRNPQIIAEGSLAFGSQCIVLSTQAKRTYRTKSSYEVFIDGARVATGLDVIDWVKKAEDLGAGEVCLNSIDQDGTMAGYDLDLLKLAEKAVGIPIIASGGAGTIEHLGDLFQQTQVQGAIISSMLYSPRSDKHYTVKEIKDGLLDMGIHVRPHGA